MAPLLEDPRIRQTWNQFSQNAEHATENAAAGIWTFQHTYLNPCFSTIGNGFNSCSAQCFPGQEERARRLRERGRTRGRAEFSFDFYDDWDEDEGMLGGWGNDELDRLLAGSGSHSGNVNEAPKRKRGMSYGTRGRKKGLEGDPTIIPSTSAIGFLGRLPWKLGGTLRYKPSAADLQEHPGAHRSDYNGVGEEADALMGDDLDDDVRDFMRGHTRNRSSTQSSGETSDSFRSRGDLFPSDEEDAVPLSDEFAMVLERRNTNSGTDDKSSGKTRSSKGKRPAQSRDASRTTQTSRPKGVRSGSGMSLQSTPDRLEPDLINTLSIEDLQLEEERIRLEEDEEVERKRQAALRLARERGLHAGEISEPMSSEPKQDIEEVEDEPTPPEVVEVIQATDLPPAQSEPQDDEDTTEIKDIDKDKENNFVPARLPNFG
ncbi:uncharacterized protein EAF01_011705 [Botrytis porri]|uniref:Uncharacterized protein n=1 Tax=Botrytis porri TaxID=87229 RepID=A0A4Z1KUS2_9HELO|nr:uncharacterized protein EAF01_011705 [Botrytis porri]KAF7882253.1 hypothetical protein EAF01_011705 [Botrytis porri]TGO88193.1 hypothetical protein BPOR_0177g00060 [Botrytis porri]